MKAAMKGASGHASTIGIGVDIALGAGITTKGATKGSKGSKKGILEFTYRSIETRQEAVKAARRVSLSLHIGA
jgi:hypothetical protein